tara:strand:- start:410 stop:808 length:399 start_codon:yes stop_codon:yes gene_type:complete
MSTLSVGTVKSISSAAPVFQNSSGTEQGRLARAFVRFKGSGTISINSSFNISSISDLGQGDYNINFENNFANADYCFTSGHDGAVNTGHNPNMHVYWTNRNTPLTNLIHMRCYHPMDSAKRSDGSRLCVVIF